MMGSKSSKRHHMPGVNRQNHKTLCLDFTQHLFRINLQLALAVLERDLPQCSDTDMESVTRINHQSMSDPGQTGIVRQPPEKNMCIQQEVHDKSIVWKNWRVMPCSQFLCAHGCIKIFSHPDFAPECPGFTFLLHRVFEWSEPRHGLPCLGNNHFLTCRSTFHQTGKMGFGFMDINCLHNVATPVQPD